MERFGKAGYGEDVQLMMYAAILGATILGVRCAPRCNVVMFLCFFILYTDTSKIALVIFLTCHISQTIGSNDSSAY